METTKAIMVGNGSVVHALSEWDRPVFELGVATGETATVRNTMCGALENGTNALYGRRPNKLRPAPEGAEVTCKRCLKIIDN